jgi:hypothetical protein
MIDTEYAKEIFFDYENRDGAPNVRHTTVKTYNRRLEKKYQKYVYHAFTKTHFVRIFKEEEGDSEWSYEWIKFKKELPSLPYFYNGGVEIESGYSEYYACVYESFIQQFVPFGNLALMSHRNQRATDLMYSYPRMAEVQYPCDTCNATGETDCPTGKEVCRTCKGSKYLAIQSPYKVYRKTHDTWDVDGKVFSTPSVEFYTPDTGIIDYNNKQWQQYLAQAEQAVFVQQKITTGNVESAKSKEIDREELYAWLANIAKVLYNNLEMFLQNLENYIVGSPMEVSVEKPYSFAILTESEAFEALVGMLASPAPILLKASQIDSFVNKFVSESSPVKRALQILKKYDLLLYYSDAAVAGMKGQNFIDEKMCQKHALAYPLLVQMYESEENLFDLEDEAIMKKLDVEVAKYNTGNNLRESIINNPEI